MTPSPLDSGPYRPCARGEWEGTAWLAAALLVVSGGLGCDSAGPAGAGDGGGAGELRALLAACRLAVSVGTGTEAELARAEAACQGVLALEPLEPEAHALLRRVHDEQEAARRYARAEHALARRDDEAALEHLGRIPPGSAFSARARAQERAVLERVDRRTHDECRRLLGAGQPARALPACERHFRLACGSAGPAGHAGRSAPEDPLLRDFLAARRALHPQGEPWRCPPEGGGEAPGAALPEGAAEPWEQRTLERYREGRSAEAQRLLQRVRADAGQTHHHPRAEALQRELARAERLFKAGQAALRDDTPERAVGPLEALLEVERRLLPEATSDAPSYYRRTLQRALAAAAYRRGAQLADREHYPAACGLWRKAFELYRGDADLNRAVAYCAQRALEALRGAEDCGALAQALGRAAEGDGTAERIREEQRRRGCPGV